MASTRRLYTGAPGSSLRDQLLDASPPDPASLWVVPSSLAALQVKRILGTRAHGSVPYPRVWCWPDLWRAIGESSADGPICLSTTASNAVFHEAIRTSQDSGELTPLASVIDWPGYRRQLQERFADWTRDEQAPTPVNPDAEPVATAEHALFGRYRDLLNSLGAEDAAGFEVWASKRLLKRTPEPFRSFHQVSFFDWQSGSPAQWRFLRHVIKRARTVHISLTYEDDAASRSIHELSHPVRARLLELGFVETVVPVDLWRPAGLRDVEQTLFRPREPAGINATQGLLIRGAPQRDGVARLVAREIKSLLDEGAEPDQILVLFRHQGEQADRAFEIARDWNLPVSTTSSSPLTRDPVITALLLATGLPIEDWETTQLIRLLRHGRFRPDWPKTGPLDFSFAAALLKKSRVYRGKQSIQRALDRAVVEAESQNNHASADRARQARTVVNRVMALLEQFDKPGSWSDQVDHLEQLTQALGLARLDDSRHQSDHSALDLLREALEDQGDILGRLGRHDETWTWSRFVAELQSLVNRTAAATTLLAPGSVIFATLDQVAGVRVPFVILADLTEGSFPSRAAVEPFLSVRPGDEPTAACRRAASREMLRFLGVLGSAESRVILVYPTTDSKGQELLRAGYLDDLLDLLTPSVRAICHQSIARFDASLIDTPELAGSPSDRRIRASALAATRADYSALQRFHESADLHQHESRLSPAHGAAMALQVLRARMRFTPFDIYDGLLSDPRAIEHIQQVFGSHFTFSPSQLETYIACPFQFFSKYVLKLETSDDRDELDEDFTTRGSRIHDILEQLETLLIARRAKGEPIDDEAIATEARIALREHMVSDLARGSEVEAGLEEIERLRLGFAVDRYVHQSRNYLDDPQARPSPHLLEVDFGGERSDKPCLEIGDAEHTVRLRGKIDRIDLIDSPEGQSFRVIDYKSGSVPSTSDVRDARLLQLPLYAMAVERVILPHEEIALRDVGYWGLKKEGFRAISFTEWQEVQAAVERYVMSLVDRLRHGVFVVDSQIDDCESYCDFRAICRIRQVRAAAKQHDHAAPPELAITPGRSGRKRRDSAAPEDITMEKP